MNGISPWVAAVNEIFHDQDLPVIFKHDFDKYNVKVHAINNALWIAVTCPNESRVILRTAYAPNDHLQIKKIEPNENGVLIHLKASIGFFKVELQFPEKNKPLLRYTTAIKPKEPLVIPFWPRDMVIIGDDKARSHPEGRIHFNQEGTRSGLQYVSFDKPKSGSLLYMQNLTALNDYCEATETSLGNVVGGQWPELGFALPPTKEKPLPAGKDIVISDAFLAFSPENPKDEFALAKQFMNLLADIYVHLPLPGTQYHNWTDILEKGLNDLTNNHGCWSHADGHDYLNAYVCDYATPPELMVQLAVLSPMLEYHRWSKRDMPIIQTIKSGIPAFYDKKVSTLVRWLPSLVEDLDKSEEQLKPNVMDSWYLHHPLLHLSRIALSGDDEAKKLFLDSLPFTIKVAHHFKYEWPVFYNMETMEAIKAETKPGKGGEKDVAGLYAHVMLRAWELTKENKYLLEAKKAAKTLHGKGFELFYQANNTAFSANATLQLFQITKDKLYLDISHLCIANIMKNLQLWECNYGYAKHYNTFFGMFPLSDAPYTAAYEEQEVFASMHDYLACAGQNEILPSMSLLLAEFIRYIVQRAAFYYPPNLPKEMLSEKVKMGEVDPNLWIAIEDIHDGWEKSGEVGQEVYGAGVAFGIVPRHYYHVPGEDFMIYIDYPTSNFEYKKNKQISFSVKGSEQLTCRMAIVGNDQEKLPAFSVTRIKGNKKAIIKGNKDKVWMTEYILNGNQDINIKWGKARD
jgi:hypothetical protein